MDGTRYTDRRDIKYIPIISEQNKMYWVMSCLEFNNKSLQGNVDMDTEFAKKPFEVISLNLTS